MSSADRVRALRDRAPHARPAPGRWGGPLLAAVVSLVVALTSCSAGAAQEPSRSAASEARLSGTLTVFAAASLTETFQELGARFEAQHPGVDVVVVLAGSATLAQQLIAGAPADVFAAADPETMARVVEEEVVDAPHEFARNPLALAVPAGNPGGVSGFVDLERQELVVALCASEVPCGRAADALLEARGVVPAVDTRESDVRAVLTKIELGEVDVGIVYGSDVRVAGARVESIAGDAAELRRFAPTYQLGVVRESRQRVAAEAWVRLVLGSEGRAVLSAAGFEVPS